MPGRRQTIPVPMAIGHEFVGEIVAVGSNVNDFHPGELVSGEGHVVCGRCRNCMAGDRHLCAHTSGVGVNRPGCFAEYISLPMTNVWRHDPQVDRDAAAIFDPFGNAVHTALSFDVLGEDVLITGAGPIGIMAAAVVRHAGARYVVITDVNRLPSGSGAQGERRPGAERESRRRSRTRRRQLGMNEGFDVGLEMSGNPQRLSRHDPQHGARRTDRHAGHSLPGDVHQLARGDFQHAHHQGHLRPRDV